MAEKPDANRCKGGLTIIPLHHNRTRMKQTVCSTSRRSFLILLLKTMVGVGRLTRARFYHGAKFRWRCIVPHGILLGSAFPKPCIIPQSGSDTARADAYFSKKEVPHEQILQHTQAHTYRQDAPER